MTTREPWPRARPHDLVAVPLVRGEFARFGFQPHTLGIEGESAALREALRGQKDRTALLLRFRPDQAFVQPGLGAVLCEVKTEDGTHHNFAIEADSYLAARQLKASGARVVMVFADLGAKRLVACWVQDLPQPRRIRVPDRWDYVESMKRLKADFPKAALIVESHYPSGPGSGTPYFLVPKVLRVLRPLDEFIRKELLGQEGGADA